jgi:hypothetical protein
MPGGSGPQCLTPLELLDRLATLVPPPRIHRHRYFGVLAPNSPLRTAVTARAPGATTAPPAPMAVPAAEPAHRRAARYAWALLLARIYEVFPLRCTHCGADMRIIAFITDDPTVRAILAHLGEPTAPPRIAPARGPPQWRLKVELRPSRRAHSGHSPKMARARRAHSPKPVRRARQKSWCDRMSRQFGTRLQ